MTHIVDSCVLTELAPSGVGLITLNRPKVLNALSLEMIRHLTRVLQDWRTDPAVKAVALRGMGKAGDGFAPFGAFCAGGDIRFFHQAALSGDPSLGSFLHRGIRAQPSDPHLRQALHCLDGWRCDGWGHGY